MPSTPRLLNVKLSSDLDVDIVSKARQPCLEIIAQDLRDLLRRAQVVLADDLDLQRPDARAVARDAAEFAESTLLVAAHFDVELQPDAGAVESRFGLVDGAATEGGAVVGARFVVSEVDDGRHGAVAPDIGFDQTVGERVVAVLAALVVEALLAMDESRCLLGCEDPRSGKALGVGASDLGKLGEMSGDLPGGLVGPQLAHLLDVMFAQETIGLDGLGVGSGDVPEDSPTSSDSGPCIEGRDG